MSAKIRYTNEPLGKLKIVPDFLPKPEDLVLRGDSVKVTSLYPGTASSSSSAKPRGTARSTNA